jgi:predicted pyridoxine 5'-phosphate oxidase superfamily flavin-nucleotide-binding protein
MPEFFHAEQKALQAEMGTTRIAERIEQTRRRTAFNETDAEIIGNAQVFFIASSAKDGTLDCSVKCGPEGFVRLEGNSTLVFPDYDGNGMFRTLGNIRSTSRVALLFLEFFGEKRKLRIHGRAEVVTDPAQVRAHKGAHAAVRVAVKDIFPNCPRYLPTLHQIERSEFVEALGEHPLEPFWKSKPDLKDYVHDRKAF